MSSIGVCDVMSGNAEVVFDGRNSTIIISGEWKLLHYNVNTDAVIEKIKKNRQIELLKINTNNLGPWDSSLVAFLSRMRDFCSANNIKYDITEVPSGIKKLLELSNSAVTENSFVKKNEREPSSNAFFKATLFILICLKNFAYSVGEICLSIARFFTGNAKIRWKEFWILIQEVGINALPIVSLISFLVGIIISFISVLQLQKFGASIYVADLIGISMMREMGCIMTGIIMSGRTGASFAATIGTMITNDEVDALRTSGFSAVDFLTLPRVLALTIMMPILCIFSDFIGIFGGMIAAISSSSLTVTQFCTQLVKAVHIKEFFIGIFKGSVFGVLVSSIGCVKGMQCDRSAEGVGVVTTSAVVSSITAIIIADAIFAVAFSAIGI